MQLYRSGCPAVTDGLDRFRVPSDRVTTTRVTPAWPIRCASAAASSLGRTVDTPNRITDPTAASPATAARASRYAAPITTPAWLTTTTGPNPWAFGKPSVRAAGVLSATVAARRRVN